MHPKLTQSLTFSPTGFSLGRSDPTSDETTRVFVFFRFFRDFYVCFSQVLKLLVNERTMLTLGFYVQKWNCLTVFPEQPYILDVKERYLLWR